MTVKETDNKRDRQSRDGQSKRQAVVNDTESQRDSKSERQTVKEIGSQLDRQSKRQSDQSKRQPVKETLQLEPKQSG